MSNGPAQGVPLSVILDLSRILGALEPALAANYTIFQPGKCTRLQANGLSVGSGYGSRGSVRDVKMTLAAGDVLVLLSDGLLEALNNTTNRIFGENGIVAAVQGVLSSEPEAIAKEILQAVVQHTGREIPTDDQTIAVLCVRK